MKMPARTADRSDKIGGTDKCCNWHEQANKPVKRLCWRCCRLFEALEANYTGFTIDPFHENGDVLQESLDFGCSICSLLLDDYVSSLPNKVSVSKIGGCTDLEFVFYGGQPTSTRTLLLCRIEDDELLFNKCHSALSAPNTGSEASLDFAATLLSRCVDCHRDCLDTRVPSSYPTRLLDIKQDVIRLVDSCESRISGPYATLSHTWGHTDIKLLTRQTLPEFSSGIDIRDIPLTFQNAITVARKLNIWYLWIDCYCILQGRDSEDEEKQKEISKMGQVYSNAVINIGAGAARSPLDGFFRNVRELHRFAIKIKFSSRNRRRSSTYLVNDTMSLEEQQRSCFQRERNSILRRAWCLQERFLCPRMLHFSDTGVFWECPSMELGSARLPTQSSRIRRNRPNRTPFSMRADNNTPRHTNLKEWDNIILFYTAMELSRPDSDKLAACGAVAKNMAELLDCEYIAGFFRESLIVSLSWVVKKDKENRRNAQRSQTWRAPSWSWASTNAEVEVSWFDDKPSPPCAQLISYDCQLVDPWNPYGALKSAIITVKGPFMEVEHNISTSHYADAAIRVGRTEIDVYFDDQNEPRQWLFVLLTRIHDVQPDFLPRIFSNPGGRFLYGLLLVRVGKQSRGQTAVYRRVGALHKGQLKVGGKPQSGRYDAVNRAIFDETYQMLCQESNQQVVSII